MLMHEKIMCDPYIESTGNRTVLSMRIQNSQSPLVIDNTLNCSEMHLPVRQSIQLIYQRKSTFITA